MNQYRPVDVVSVFITIVTLIILFILSVTNQGRIIKLEDKIDWIMERNQSNVIDWEEKDEKGNVKMIKPEWKTWKEIYQEEK